VVHTSTLYLIRQQVELAEKVARVSGIPDARVFFTNSGTEANECAIKLVRKHAHGRGIEEPEIVSLQRAFHGRSMGSLAATPEMARNPAFAPMLPGFRWVPIDSPERLREAVGESTAAVIAEPILGEAGVYPVPEETLAAAREACDEAGALLVLDEIQTGMGRTGSLWAYEQLPVRPDVITSAKALGGGLPVGACVAAPPLADVLQPGDHGSTFAGGPLVATAALTALELTDDPQLLRGVRETGADLRERLEAIDGVREVRGRGLMLGVGLADRIDASEAAAAALASGLVVNVPEPGTLRLLPPLTIGEAEVERGCSLLAAALAAV
jgi:acetylornithine/N-succinyldiaminopimelate aminotransferase